MNRYSEHNHLPPVLRKDDDPAVRTTMAHFKDYGPLSMIGEEIGGMKSVSKSLGKLLAPSCEGRAHQPDARSPERS